MNKSDLIKQVASKTGMSKKDSEKVVNTIFDSITEKLSKGDKIQLTGFGTFEIHKRKEHLGRDPVSREKITIRALKIPAFKPSMPLKLKVSGGLETGTGGPETGSGGPGVTEDQ